MNDRSSVSLTEEHAQCNVVAGTAGDDSIRELQDAVEKFKHAYKVLKQCRDDGEGSLIDKVVQSLFAFDDARKPMERCISKWSLKKRRRANTLKEGGIDPDDESRSELMRIKLLASRCVKYLCRISLMISDGGLLSQAQVKCSFVPVHSHWYLEETINRLRDLAYLTTVVTRLSSQILKKNKNIEIEVELLIATALKQHDPSFEASLSFGLVCHSELQQLLANCSAPLKKIASLQVVAQSAAPAPASAPGIANARQAKRRRLNGSESGAAATAAAAAAAAAGRWTYTLKRSQSPAKDSSHPEGPSTSNARSDSTALLRSRKPSELSVTEIKSAVVFDVRIVFRDYEWLFRTHSMPVVLASHVKQQSASWCTLFWDNAFSADERQPFEVPESVIKTSFLSSLQQWFAARTGRELNQSQLNYLARCLPDHVTMHFLANVDKSNEELRFPFWSWFYKCTRLICHNSQILQFWRNEWIHGFISTADARELLYCYPGGALIRFSTKSKKGAICVLQLPKPDEFMTYQQIRKYGHWKLDDFEKLDFHNSLYDLRITSLAPQISWITALGLNEREFLRNSSENDGSDLEGVDYVPTIIRRCCHDPITDMF